MIILIPIISRMKLEQKKELLSMADKKYVIIRDEDGEILCMLSNEDNQYTAYTLEQYVLLKEDVYKILDKAAAINLIDKIDKNALKKEE